MNSNDRKLSRYKRRQQRRLDRKIKRNEEIGDLNTIFNYKDLFLAGKKGCRGVRWKCSVQNFELHLFSGTAIRLKRVREGIWKPGKYYNFLIDERGKIRDVDAPTIQDKQVEKLFTKKVLLPAYQPQLIYNNGASLPGKGFSFTKRELKKDLIEFFRLYGKNGYIILFDGKHFFPSASHDIIIENHERYILNEDFKRLGYEIIKASGREVGLPLGIEPSQVEMINYPTKLDNYMKCQLELHYAGHYMDDFYILVPPYLDPHEVLDKVMEKAKENKLTLSKHKTVIKPLTKPFRFCKAKYFLTDTGKVVVQGNRKSAGRNRHKILAFYRMVQEGKMSFESLYISVNSMLAYMKQYDDHNKLMKLKRLFYSLFQFDCENLETFRLLDKWDQEGTLRCQDT